MAVLRKHIKTEFMAEDPEYDRGLQDGLELSRHDKTKEILDIAMKDINHRNYMKGFQAGAAIAGLAKRHKELMDAIDRAVLWKQTQENIDDIFSAPKKLGYGR